MKYLLATAAVLALTSVSATGAERTGPRMLTPRFALGRASSLAVSYALWDMPTPV
jgi:hypothetical protein